MSRQRFKRPRLKARSSRSTRRAPLEADAPGVSAIYADRPTRLVLDGLLRTQTKTADAVRVVARLDASDGAFRLAFEDNAGVRLRSDGTTDPGPFTDGTTDASDLVQCCSAFRSQVPDRFWLERDGQRLIEFSRIP